MRTVVLQKPIARAVGTVTKLDIRQPGARLVEVMSAARVPAGFTDSGVIKFAARLSGVQEMHLRKLDPVDMPAVRDALETTYQRERRRYAARAAIAGVDKDRHGAETVREVLDGRR